MLKIQLILDTVRGDAKVNTNTACVWIELVAAKGIPKRGKQWKYKQYGTITDKEKQQLAKEGTCFFCKQSGHLASDCTKKQISSNTMQVRYKPGLKIKSARVVIEDMKASSLQVAKPPTDTRMHLCNGMPPFGFIPRACI